MRRAALGALVALAVLAPAASARRACQASVARGVLPSWARTGFSDPRPRMPHAVARSGSIAALFFGDPLRFPAPEAPVEQGPVGGAPHPERRRRTCGSAHSACAAPGAVGRHVIRVVRGGPGPSYLNLPAEGCWRLTLSWSRRRDELDVRVR